jgi:uncharacterized 2Fe-2S/4Fe-4S cluster protein (DUF4445 family)
VVEITEADIASLLQAKAAIAAGIVCLLRRVGLNPEDLATCIWQAASAFT